MKIVHYIPSIDRTSGGVGAYMQLLSKDLGRLCELYVVTAVSEHPLEIENARVITIPCDWRQYGAMKREWRKLLNDIRPDIVHVNCCWTPQCAWAQRWAQEAGYKVVLTPHGMLEPWIMRRHYWTKKFPALLLYQKDAIKNADCLHATAESERQNLLALGWNSNISVIGNCVNVDDIQMKPSWKRTGNILFLSRVHVKKGINFLIEAVAKVREECRMKGEECSISRCIIAGEGDEAYIKELKGLATRLGVSHIVDFAGGVYGDRKWQLFHQTDLFVLPTHSENFGIVVTEALACGTPVITTKGTPWEELEGYKCGWWTEVGTAATVKALREFLSLSESELETMGRNGRKLVEEKYSTKTIARQMMEMYGSIAI